MGKVESNSDKLYPSNLETCDDVEYCQIEASVVLCLCGDLVINFRAAVLYMELKYKMEG